MVVDVIVTPVLEGVDGKVEVLPVVVTKVAASSKRSTIKQLDLKGLRLEGTELQGLFSWTASRRMRGRRASEVDTSNRLGCHQWSVAFPNVVVIGRLTGTSVCLDGQQWSVVEAVMLPLRSGGAAVARWGCTWKVEILFRFAEAVSALVG